MDNDPKGYNDLAKQIVASGGRTAYDKAALNVLKDRQFLAWILKECASEFRDMAIADIIPCIEDPLIATVPVEPGLTNSYGSITGLPTESKTIGEGTLTYDIRFAVRNPTATKAQLRKKINIRIQMDVEVQKKESPGYDLVPRGMLYGGRMLSAQMGHQVRNSEYDRLEKAYSIWICLDTPASRANTITRYSIHQDMIYGEVNSVDKLFRARYDLIEVIMIRLPKERTTRKAANPPTKLMKILSTAFSGRMSTRRRLDMLEELGITVTEEMEGSVNTMCNLSEGIFEAGQKEEKKNTMREKARADKEKKRADELEKENERLRQMLAQRTAKL